MNRRESRIMLSATIFRGLVILTILFCIVLIGSRDTMISVYFKLNTESVRVSPIANQMEMGDSLLEEIKAEIKSSKEQLSSKDKKESKGKPDSNLDENESGSNAILQLDTPTEHNNTNMAVFHQQSREDNVLGDTLRNTNNMVKSKIERNTMESNVQHDKQIEQEDKNIAEIHKLSRDNTTVESKINKVETNDTEKGKKISEAKRIWNNRPSIFVEDKSENIRTKVLAEKKIKYKTEVLNEDSSNKYLNKNVRLDISQQEVKGNGTTDDVKVLSKKRIVIIVAYMRTGSTLTASLLQEYKNTFYVFEPIRYLFQMFKSKHVTLKYLNGTSRYFPTSRKQDIVQNEIMSWLTCQIGDISVGSLTDNFHSSYTKYMKGFNECYKNTKKWNSKYAINQCLLGVMTKCRDSPLLVLKFIRLRMQDAVKLLPYFPNMKILHLVRDPRGILNSRMKLKEELSRNVQSLCSMMREDLEVTKAMQENFHGRIKIVYYEDMAKRPMMTSKAISSFSGIVFTVHMQSYIKSQISASSDSCGYCTARANSTLTADKWRNELNPKYATLIYKTCESSNKYLGYLPFRTDSDQKNLEVLSRKRIVWWKNSPMLMS